MTPDPLPRQDVAEGAPYDHPDHGPVRVVLIDDGTVYAEQLDDHTAPTRMFSDTLDRFRRIASPLSQTMALPTGTATTDTAIGGR